MAAEHREATASHIIFFVFLILAFILLSKAVAEANSYQNAIRSGGEWFLNNQNDFFLFYEYDPEQKTHLTTQHPLREMASMWSVAALSDFLDEPRLRRLAEKGFSSFENSFLYDEESGFYYSGVTPGDVKLSYSAFIILTLLEIYPDSEYLEGFADGILSLQNEDGSFRTHFYSDDASGQDYYPGEALFALMSLYEQAGDERYLAAVEKALPNYYRSYWKWYPNTAFVPWQSRAYYLFYKATRDQEAADFVFEMNDFMLNQYAPSGDCSGFDFAGHGVTSGVHIEGVVQAYELARLVGDVGRQRCYANYVREGVDYLVSAQAAGPGQERAAVGGFIGSDGLMRVDHTQHAVLALMGACEAGIMYCGA